MATTKKVLSLFLVAMMIVCVLPIQAFAASPASSNFELFVNPYGKEQDSFDTIRWHKSLGTYYLFLPADCDWSALTVYFDTIYPVTVNNRAITNGEVTDVFSTGEKFTIKCGSNSYLLRVMQSANIPAMYIQTDEPLSYIHADKNNKTSASIRTYEGGNMTFDGQLKQIKGRGNSTWNYAKKPYNIKFNKKTALLGMPKAKKWSMLAAYIDPAMIKDPLGWELSSQLGLNYASEYRFVDLYINNEYMGTYIVCESVEVGENRIDITDLAKATEDANKGIDIESCPIVGSGPDGQPESKEICPRAKWVDIPNDPEDITGGYLLECEYPSRSNAEISEFATTRGQLMVVKEPEYASKAQIQYISTYWQEAEDAICSADGYNDLGKHYSDYFDMDSLVNMYILLEFSGNVEAGISSTFFYKDKGGKLVAGPIWDNDTAFGNITLRRAIVGTDPSLWIVNRVNYNWITFTPTKDEYPAIYHRLYQLADFRERVCQRWAELRGVFNAWNILHLIDSLADTLEASAIMNGIRWYSVFSKELYTVTVDMSRSYLTQRIYWLNKGFSQNAAQLYYDPNGGIGWTAENRILMNGQYATVNEPYNTDLPDLDDLFGSSSLSELLAKFITPIVPPSDDLMFAGWNTEPDGSGTAYPPGSRLKMDGTITLYAQWQPILAGEKMDYDCALLIDNPLYDFSRSVRNVIAMYCVNFHHKILHTVTDYLKTGKGINQYA